MSESGGEDLMAAARSWLSDLQWADDEPGFGAMPGARIRRGVGKHYDGGWRAFVQDGPEPARRDRTARGRERKQENRPAGRSPR
jgi:hypothetical protein